MKPKAMTVDDCSAALSFFEYLPNRPTYTNDTQDPKNTKADIERTPSLHAILQKLPEEPEGEVDAELQVAYTRTCRSMFYECQ